MAAAGLGADAAFPGPGATFGHYRIGRRLGHGGMGTVFEAEDLESGRRVALKVLGHRLDSPEARTRFFREGRLAASVNHPNSVYVFGTEDIAGIPVIAMELATGGTLQDRVRRQGPLPVGEVVDGALQIIAGLEAAQRVGVLHRDIKPSNCFVEADGTVKIGDFGLSVSTLVRTEPSLTAAGAFLGTPAFSSPEQLRGDELTVRSDIYSVGVTLYYLLTGHYPFEAPDMVRLLATVLERRAESPARWRPELPSPLCAAVLRCLEKDPEKRFRGYGELRDALLPFASAAASAAPFQLRILAYVLDSALLALPFGLFNLASNRTLAGYLQDTSARLTAGEMSNAWLLNLAQVALALAYFGLLEGLWSASLGKRICRIRLVRPRRAAPGVPRALFRSLLFIAIPHLTWMSGWSLAQAWAPDPSIAHWTTAASLLSLALLPLMFVTARQGNGYAGLHDLASHTRVTVRTAHTPRPTLPQTPEALPRVDTLPLIGPYHILDRLGVADGVELFLAFDARLLRRVWIRRQPPGTPPLPPSLRNLARPGRLRWLTGRRADEESWDAYEAASGQPLLALISKPQDWSRVRFWLLDLAEELHAAGQEGSLPDTLGLDRVWITEDGRAKLLDFAAPGAAACAPDRITLSGSPGLTPSAFLKQVAHSALEGGPTGADGRIDRPPRVPLAIHAVRLLERLQPGPDLRGFVKELRSSLGRAARVSRGRRAALLGAALALPLLAVAIEAFSQDYSRAAHLRAERTALLRCLARHEMLEIQAPAGEPEVRADLLALETYVAGRFGYLITNREPSAPPAPMDLVPHPIRSRAERIVRECSAPTPEQRAAASAWAERHLGPSEDPKPDSLSTLTFGVGTAGYINAVVFVIIPCLAASLLFRGGALVRILGIVFVLGSGLLASRWRVTVRNALAWLPLLLSPVLTRLLAPHSGPDLALALVVVLCACLALVSVLLPGRGLADRVVGIWPVPR